ncbi:MAG: FAD-dependent oxidoreductase [Alphaproteobacteria bacterium]|nr:FAD-dependent oxidoreductase [Alphaproteobacteria bacterium]
MSGTVHIIGAGLAGLSCAVKAVKSGKRVVIYEANSVAGGRCRSFYDKKLGRELDNGTHMVLGANKAVFEYLDIIGAVDELIPVEPVKFPFLDMKTGDKWTLKPSAGWIFFPSKRVKGSCFFDYLKALKLKNTKKNQTVADILSEPANLYERLWRPLTESALNTSPEKASARLLWQVVSKSFLKGKKACQPFIMKSSLSSTFINPALKYLEKNGVKIHYNTRLESIPCKDFITEIKFSSKNTHRCHSQPKGLGIQNADKEERLDTQACSLSMTGEVQLGKNDSVVLAIPHSNARKLLLGETLPQKSSAIVNAHFLMEKHSSTQFLGLVGATTQWLFVKDDVLSVTVSNANELAKKPINEIAEILWNDASKALNLDEKSFPPYRIIKERKATILHSPEEEKTRPLTLSNASNLFLAGDWTNTNLPCTIDGAIQSGVRASFLNQF